MKDEILEIISKPDQPCEGSINLVEKLIEEYPYFQPSYFLALRHYKKYNFLKYSQVLSQYVLYVYDRSLLQDFINNNVSLNAPDSSKTETNSIEPTLSDLSNKSEDFQTPVASARKDMDTLRETIAEALDQTSNIEVTDNFEKKILPDVNFELDDSIEIIKPSPDDEDFIVRSTNKISNDENILILDESETVQQEIFDNKNINPHNEVDQLDNNDKDEDNSEEKANNSTKASNQFDLIDKFLEELPHIKPKPLEKTATVHNDISEASIEAHDDFMTETFAKILIKQGNFEKAIEIYKKLILKFPEKNTYFVSQIKEIEKLINNNKI
jgi:tetratricopeptide (TPR) repeat protein